VNERDFKKLGEDIHFRVQEELFKKDKQKQQQFHQQFTTQPAAYRERMQMIEAGAMGYTIQDGYPIKNDTKEPATEQQNASIQKATDKAMLRSNPDLEKYNMRYENNFFIPIDYKKLLEKEG
tara:strand:+ start:199 stop:564 length:366 start_codon:yes stop_codon:yes gene_type:complete